MIAGIVLFGVSYVVPAIIGGMVGSLNEDTCDCMDAYRMFIPIAGPLTLLHNDRDYRGLNALLITDTVLQSAGLVMAIIGIMRFVASGQEPTAQLREPRLQLVTAPTPSGGYAALRWQL
jgi:hypothetical protein